MSAVKINYHVYEGDGATTPICTYCNGEIQEGDEYVVLDFGIGSNDRYHEPCYARALAEPMYFD